MQVTSEQPLVNHIRPFWDPTVINLIGLVTLAKQQFLVLKIIVNKMRNMSFLTTGQSYKFHMAIRDYYFMIIPSVTARKPLLRLSKSMARRPLRRRSPGPGRARTSTLEIVVKAIYAASEI